MQTVFSAEGTLYIYDEEWKELGDGGEIMLDMNNSDQFDIRLYYESSDRNSLTIPLVPQQLKSKGPCSWIFRYKVCSPLKYY